ncbi:MAG: hypothetical protein ACUZ8H_06345 [Candidatus Anammoxibacter sp.]
MADKQIFLSHIHEEQKLADVIKEAIEVEFSGFVEIFVSSGETSIPVGTNFLKKIEESLVNCIGALYLISPMSVKRNWINFELGAVWIRNAISLRQEGPDIPALPICHSGMTPGDLLQPIGNLNAIVANKASQLELAFKSLQSAVGGKGKLKTDFDSLVQKVISFEREYTLGDNVKKFVSLFNANTSPLIQHCENLPSDTTRTTLNFGFIPTAMIQKIRAFEENELNGRICLTTTNPGVSFGNQGAINGAEVSVTIDVDLITEFKDIL